VAKTARPKLHERPLRGLRNRLLQRIARNAPGGRSLRVWLHRLRGVRLGRDAFIGLDVVIETSFPELVSTGDRVILGMRTLIVAHFDGDVAAHGVPERPTVRLEDEVFIGPGVIIMPNVTIGSGSVIAAGTVVTRSVPPRRFVQGNPAEVVGVCNRPLNPSTSTWEFLGGLERHRPQEEGET
jgi:acetyltransferase-like isoleucine patch superfamily enzyme